MSNPFENFWTFLVRFEHNYLKKQVNDIKEVDDFWSQTPNTNKLPLTGGWNYNINITLGHSHASYLLPSPQPMPWIWNHSSFMEQLHVSKLRATNGSWKHHWPAAREETGRKLHLHQTVQRCWPLTFHAQTQCSHCFLLLLQFTPPAGLDMAPPRPPSQPSLAKRVTPQKAIRASKI